MRRAIWRRPSGFSDVDDHKTEVTIVGYVWGKSKDVGRYSDNRDECTLAICVDEHGGLSSVPIANLKMQLEPDLRSLEDKP